MLDCACVEALRLQFPNQEQADLVLSPGVHAIGRGSGGRGARPVTESHPAADAVVAQIYVDRRGVWLQVREGVRGLHVNGRPVRRMAMLRVGDAIFLEGTELLLLAASPQPAPPFGVPIIGDSRMVVRGVGGLHHGRCFTLEQPRLIGRASDCDIRINEPAFAERHARLEAHEDGVVLRDMGSAEGSLVNGLPVRHAMLQPGDQLVLDGQHRFVIEAPVMRQSADAAFAHTPPAPQEAEKPRPASSSALLASVRRMPWLLLAAMLLAGSLGLLLLYGVR